MKMGSIHHLFTIHHDFHPGIYDTGDYGKWKIDEHQQWEKIHEDSPVHLGIHIHYGWCESIG